MVNTAAFLKRVFHQLVQQALDAHDPAVALVRRSARDLPMLQAPLQQQNITFSNAGLFELLECQ